MKKYVLVLLLVVGVLVSSQLAAVGLEPANLFGETQETKIMTIEEVAGFQYELPDLNDLQFENLAPPSMRSDDLPFLGNRYRGIISDKADIQKARHDLLVIYTDYLAYRLNLNILGGDCSGGFIPAMASANNEWSLR